MLRLRTPNFEYATEVSRVELGGLILEVEHLADIDRTIDELFEHYLSQGKTELFEEMCPYFGIIWPAARVLAHVVAEREAEWRHELGESPRVLEIGCGLALPSLVLAARGWSVTARDLHPDVEYFLRQNLARLGSVNLDFELASWQQPRAENWSLILASDVLYDKTQPASLAQYLATQLASGSGEANLADHRRALICDPGRGYLDEFISRARDLNLSVSSEALFGCRLLELQRNRA
jgi:predicted nicotinamide N-methyase